MTEVRRRARWVAVARLLLVLSLSIFMVEAAIMFALEPYLQSHPMLVTIIDPAILTLVLLPLLYFSVFKKMMRKSDALVSARRGLRAALHGLEDRVDARTREVEETKRDLQDSLQRFTDIAETAGDWIWEMDGNLRFSFMSPRFFEVFPIAREDLIGKTRAEFSGQSVFDEHWRQHFDDLANHRPFRNFTYASGHLDARPRHVQISGKPVFDHNGVFTGYRGTGTDKTADFQARTALIQSEKQFRNLIEGSIQGVFIHENGNLLFANKALADILGYDSSHDILALTTIDALIAPDERKRLLDFRIARQNGADAPEIYEARGLHKDGSHIWLEFRSRIIEWHGFPAIQSVVVDITQHKNAERALRDQKEQLDRILQHVPQAVISINSDGIVKSFNPAAKTTFGYTAEEIVGKNVSILMPKTERNSHDKYIGSYLETGIKKVIDRNHRRAMGLHRDGHEFPLELAIAQVGYDSKDKLFIGVARDITKQLEAEETLRLQNQKLKKNDRQLKEKNEHFNAALENMSQGLCMFDNKQRLVVCNERYATIYGLRPDQFSVGMALGEILELRIANGMYSGNNPEQYTLERYAAAKDRQPGTTVHELPDGRVVAIQHKPLKNGGWLDTHEDITEYRRIEKRLAHLAHHDPLTGLANRALLLERMESQLNDDKYSEDFALLYLDLDGFKGINDTLGHGAGDKLLKIVSDRLRQCVSETDMVARLGGDEFAVLQSSTKDSTQATGLAERICNAISAPVDLGHSEVIVGTSVGIALSPKDGTDPDQLLKKADLALYHAKSVSRGTYSLFEPELETNSKHRQAMGFNLRGALAKHEFELYYQPIMNLKESRVGGFEALLRWPQKTGVSVPPSEFIPIAEETGLINEIGEWALNQACAEAALWPENIKVAVNVSPVQFVRGNIVQLVRDALEASGLRANRLELEITETVLLQDSGATLAILQELKKLGVRISMDDFGTGYSSLSYLRRFPFTKIKIDRSFVSELALGDTDIGIVQAVIGLASRLGVETTAEGVETEAQLEILMAEGCTEAQGYLFAPPLPAKDIRHMFPKSLKKMTRAS